MDDLRRIGWRQSASFHPMHPKKEFRNQSLRIDLDAWLENAMATQKTLFPGVESKPQEVVPEGFRYREDIISEAEEGALAASLALLELKPFEFHGHLGNRRVAAFGLRYDFTRRSVETADQFPSFLAGLREKVAKFAGRPVDDFKQGGVNEYPPGAGIGWHKDKFQFGVVVGVSLLAPATMRFRRKEGDRWLRMSQRVLPRSIYILEGEARTMWEHSIPPVDALRYSLTFRTLAEDFKPR
jgi:alkylated DNA repair dioxygenase AlkB